MSVVAIGPAAIDAVAALDLEVFPESERTVLGARYARAFIGWFAGRPDAIALVAWENGLPVGYVVGADERLTSAIYRGLAGTAARSVISRPWVLLDDRVRQMLRVRARAALTFSRRRSPTLADGSQLRSTIRLHTIGVAASHRRGGIGRLLLEHFCEQARSRHARSIVLEALNDNEAARRFYLERGWQVGPRGRVRTSYSLSLDRERA